MENLIEMTILTPLISIIIFVMMIVLMIYCSKNFRYLEAILLIFLISVVIGVMSIQANILPFSPIIQVFFMLFQLVYLVRASLNTNFKGNNNE